MLKVSYLYPEVHNCCKIQSLPAPLCQVLYFLIDCRVQKMVLPNWRRH